jgi:hypothetical protein
MAKPVILAVDDDPVLLFPVIRPTPPGTSASRTVERPRSTLGEIRCVVRLPLKETSRKGRFS